MPFVDCLHFIQAIRHFYKKKCSLKDCLHFIQAIRHFYKKKWLRQLRIDLRYSACSLRYSVTLRCALRYLTFRSALLAHPAKMRGRTNMVRFLLTQKMRKCYHFRKSSFTDPFFLPQIKFGQKNGSGSWIRTSDQVVNSHLLYR